MNNKFLSAILIIVIATSFLYTEPVFAGGAVDAVRETVGGIFNDIGDFIDENILTPLIIVPVNWIIASTEVLVSGATEIFCKKTGNGEACKLADDLASDAKCRFEHLRNPNFVSLECGGSGNTPGGKNPPGTSGCSAGQCSYRCVRSGSITSCCGSCSGPNGPGTDCSLTPDSVYCINQSCQANPNNPNCALIRNCETNPNDPACAGVLDVLGRGSGSGGGSGGGSWITSSDIQSYSGSNSCDALSFSGINAQGHNYAIVRDGNIVAQLPASQTDYTDSGLTPHTQYDYKIRIPYPEEEGYQTSDSDSISGTYTMCAPRCGFGVKEKTIVQFSTGTLIWECEHNDPVIDKGSCSIHNLKTGNVSGVEANGGSLDVKGNATTDYALICTNMDGSVSLQQTLNVFVPTYKEVKP